MGGAFGCDEWRIYDFLLKSGGERAAQRLLEKYFWKCSLFYLQDIAIEDVGFGKNYINMASGRLKVKSKEEMVVK